MFTYVVTANAPYYYTPSNTETVSPFVFKGIDVGLTQSTSQVVDTKNGAVTTVLKKSEVRSALSEILNLLSGSWSEKKTMLGLYFAIMKPQLLEAYVSDDERLVLEWLLGDGRITAVITDSYAHVLRIENGKQESQWKDFNDLPIDQFANKFKDLFRN